MGKVTFYRGVANCDASGNERVVVHFFAFLTDEERRELSVLDGYELARKRAKRCGWRAYRGRNFGGGFVRQYSTTLQRLEEEIIASRK